MDKITLFDASDSKIGEVHPRRARQLVKKQRAVWVDETQAAIRFYAGMENQGDIEDDEINELVELYKAMSAGDKTDPSTFDPARAAEDSNRRSNMIKWFVIHSVATSLIWIFGFAVAVTVVPSRIPIWHVMIVPLAVMAMGYLTHLGYFAASIRDGEQRPSKTARTVAMAAALKRQLEK